MRDDDIVRSASRVLALLEALNERDNATLVFLQTRTQLPKATIVRLLHTLEHAGYALQLSRSEGYTLTERVLRLSSGFRHTDRVVAVGRGYLDAFAAAHKWPVSLQTYDRGAMRFRYGTREQSPLSTDPPVEAQGERLDCRLSPPQQPGPRGGATLSDHSAENHESSPYPERTRVN